MALRIFDRFYVENTWAPAKKVPNQKNAFPVESELKLLDLGRSSKNRETQFLTLKNVLRQKIFELRKHPHFAWLSQA